MSGAGGAATGGAFSTSVPGTTPIKDLTPDQEAQLCSDLKKFADALSAPYADYVCKATALVGAAQAMTDADAKTACEAALANCAPADTTDECDVNVAATCTSTVADVSACFNDTAATFAAFDASVPSCVGMTLAQAKAALATLAANNPEGPMEPASCTKVDNECPEMMSGMM
jgi:hypothetical protein